MAKSSKVTKINYATETASHRNRRLGPSRRIIKFVNKHVGRAGNDVHIAVLECKHVRAIDMTPRQHLRCRKCRDNRPKDVQTTNITRYLRAKKVAEKAA